MNTDILMFHSPPTMPLRAGDELRHSSDESGTPYQMTLCHQGCNAAAMCFSFLRFLFWCFTTIQSVLVNLDLVRLWARDPAEPGNNPPSFSKSWFCQDTYKHWRQVIYWTEEGMGLMKIWETKRASQPFHGVRSQVVFLACERDYYRLPRLANWHGGKFWTGV